MKQSILGLMFMLLITACSTKSTTTPSNCQNIVNEIDNLKKEKYTNTATKVVASAISGGYNYASKDDNSEQKIKVLELKLSECNVKNK